MVKQNDTLKFQSLPVKYLIEDGGKINDKDLEKDLNKDNIQEVKINLDTFKKEFPKYLSGHYSLILHILKFELFTSKLHFVDIDEISLSENIDYYNFYECLIVLNVKINKFHN